jgi:hypothetical protein
MMVKNIINFDRYKTKYSFSAQEMSFLLFNINSMDATTFSTEIYMGYRLHRTKCRNSLEK